tara:strand:- start:60040 stop:60375 length:336 start_codon:yes stop_codon:yes gene_type:complete
MTVKINTKLNGPLVEGMPNDYHLDHLVSDTESNTLYALGSVGALTRLYVGSRRKMEEAHVRNNLVLRDGGTRRVDFDLDEKSAVLQFPANYNNHATVAYAGELEVKLTRII